MRITPAARGAGRDEPLVHPSTHRRARRCVAECVAWECDGERLAEHAVELLSAARQLADSAADPSTATHLPDALARVGEALDALALAFERAPHSLVPTGDRLEPICRRFERAAASWPETYGCEEPSYERQAQLLSSL